MNTPIEQNLEQALGELTKPRAGDVGLWRQALESATAVKRKPRSWLSELLEIRLSRRVVWWSTAGCAVIMVAILQFVPSLSRARVSSRDRAKSSSTNGKYSFQPVPVFTKADAQSLGRDALPSSLISPSTSETTETSDLIARQVIRKATIELIHADVRATFLKIQHLLRPGGGEYVEDSSLMGMGEATLANLTLRVRADRLADVLNEIRQLGQVASERQEGQDVTGQVIDLDARLRNERQVEAELLKLLETRGNAPLKDVLELRESLSRVRQEIERLTGQRDQLSRLVSLASVLVIIRPGETDVVETRDSVWNYATSSWNQAWQAGLTFLVDTLGLGVRILIGGLIWWVLLLLIVFGISRRRRRMQALLPSSSTEL